MSWLEELKAGKLIPRKEDTKWERIIKHLKHARLILPLTDERMAEIVKQNQAKKAKKENAPGLITRHMGKGGWSFNEYLENNEFMLAWDELKWACERYEARIRIGGNWNCAKCGRMDWQDPHDIGGRRSMFWHEMSLAAREMMEDGDEPALPGYPECLRL